MFVSWESVFRPSKIICLLKCSDHKTVGKILLVKIMFLLLIMFGVKSQDDYMPLNVLSLTLDYSVICSDVCLGQLSKQRLRSTRKIVCFYFAREKI